MKSARFPTNKQPETNCRKNWLWWGILISALIICCLLLFYVFLPYPNIKLIADQLAKDGSLDGFSLSIWENTRPAAALAGVLTGIGAFLWLIASSYSCKLVARITRGVSTYSPTGDIKEIFHALRSGFSGKWFTLTLLGITFLGAGIRWLYLFQPMRYDEAYTIVGFAIRPLWNAISDYHLPNNHLFHTLLAHFSIKWFGLYDWAARLPAFCAGVLSIPAGYLGGLSFYNRKTGLLAAAWIAFSPIFVDFSANARGYTILALLTLLMLICGNYVRSHKNIIGWGCLSIVAAFGFYTLPTMLYPFGIIYLWLGLSWLWRDTNPAYGWKFPFLFFASAGLSGLLTILFYVPVLLTSGTGALFGNRFIRPLVWDEFLGNQPNRWMDTWQFWTTGWPQWVAILFVLGLIFSLVIHPRVARYKIHLLLPAVLWIFCVLLLQRVAPLPRIWLFLFPILAIIASGGLAGLEQVLPKVKRIPDLGTIGYSFLLVGITLSLVWGTVNSNLANIDNLAGPVRETREIANQLHEQILPGEIVFANSPIQAPLRFYLLSLEVPAEHIYTGQNITALKQALVVIEKGADLIQELTRLGLENIVDPSTRQTIAETAGIITYRIQKIPGSP
jgi:hypothetical protein